MTTVASIKPRWYSEFSDKIMNQVRKAEEDLGSVDEKDQSLAQGRILGMMQAAAVLEEVMGFGK